MWPLVALVVMGWSTGVATASHEPAWTVFRVVPYALRLERLGIASYYHRKFHRRPTRSGELYNHRHGLTAASNDFPLGTILEVTRVDRPWRSVRVEVNDTGELYGRLLDLSGEAALRMGMINQGTVVVRVCQVESM